MYILDNRKVKCEEIKKQLLKSLSQQRKHQRHRTRCSIERKGEGRQTERETATPQSHPPTSESASEQAGAAHATPAAAVYAVASPTWVGRSRTGRRAD